MSIDQQPWIDRFKRFLAVMFFMYDGGVALLLVLKAAGTG